MVLVDTSVWVDHFRRGVPELIKELQAGAVICHPFIIGELACGHLKNRDEILQLLQTLATAVVAGHEEVLGFIESHHLMGTGLGYVDVHLLASARLTGTPLWTRDRPLKTAAANLGCAYGT